VRLFSYFLRAYLGAFVLVQLGLVMIVVATTLVENAGDLARSDQAGLTAVLLALYSAVQFGYDVLPVACFLAALIAGTLLARSGELLAMQAAGLPPARVGAAFFAGASLVVAWGLWLGEAAVPEATARLTRLRSQELGRGDALQRFYDRRTQWFRKGDLLLFLPAVDPEHDVFSDVRVYRFDNGLIMELIEADRLVFAEGAWHLEGAHLFAVNTGEERREAVLPLGLDAVPRDLVEVAGDPHVMPQSKLRDIAVRREASGFDATAYRIESHGRIAFPLLALAMVLFAAPWMLSPDRRRSLAVNLGVGVIAIAVVLSLTQVFRLLALAHRVPPAMGAWGIDVVCLGIVPLSALWRERVRRRGTLF
jgi:LPS export ABC transporter permease LptG